MRCGGLDALRNDRAGGAVAGAADQGAVGVPGMSHAGAVQLDAQLRRCALLARFGQRGALHRRQRRGLPVLAYGLRTDFRGELFPGSARLLALALPLELPVAPRRLILLDHAEDNLFRIQRELEDDRHVHASVLSAVLADCKEGERMREVFADHRPTVVFHAAAYKHVPMVENDPSEGLLTNSYGTRVVAFYAGRIIADAIAGKDPRPVAHHWQAIYRHAFYRGGPILTSALSGIDIALWDIKGKIL